MLCVDPSRRNWMTVTMAMGFGEEFCGNISILTVVSSFFFSFLFSFLLFL